MTESKHTPGPWKAQGTRVYFPRSAGGFDLRNCPNAEANARLSAAAPDLLEGCKLAMRAFENGDHIDWSVLSDAIEKAEKGTP